MTTWKIIFYQTPSGREPVTEFIKKLSGKARLKVAWMIDLLKKYGMGLSRPYLKPISGTKNVWELRPGRYRIFLSPLPKKRILLIHGIIKKTQKTPKKEIKLVQKRLKEYLSFLK